MLRRISIKAEGIPDSDLIAESGMVSLEGDFEAPLVDPAHFGPELERQRSLPGVLGVDSDGVMDEEVVVASETAEATPQESVVAASPESQAIDTADAATESLSPGSREEDATTRRSRHPRTRSATAAPSFPIAEAWDVKKPCETGVLTSLGMIIPSVTRVALNVVGGTVAGAGYAVGKVGEVAGVKKSVDSRAFQASFTTWMWMNGVFPSVKYEEEEHQKKVGITGLLGASADCVSLTPIVIANHISYLDALIIAALFGAPKTVAKAEVQQVPVVSKVMKDVDSVFVDRSAKDSRQATLEAISNHCDGWEPGSRPLLIFPEGTTSNGETLLPFKKGAFIAGMPVRPLIIVYTGRWDPSNTNYRAMADKSGVTKTTDAEWAKEYLGSFVHSMHVRVLPPYNPSEEEINDANMYAKNCHAYMEKELKRVREEVANESWSWKGAAGRTDGSFGYQFGDVTRSLLRRLQGSPASATASGYSPASRD